MKNALTIDLEDWYHTLDFNFPIETWNSYEDRVNVGASLLLDLLDKYNIKATFFILGYVAQNHVGLVKRICEKGHEIASHGTWHKLVYKQSKEEFREDVANSKKILEDITGKEVNIFRASSWSISEDTLWALEVLQKEGYKCDSSIQPFKTPLSGINNMPVKPFYPIIGEKKLDILEFPPTVLKMGGMKIPFCGGLYLRVMPYKFIEKAINIVNKERSGLVYVHPWEFDVKQPKLKVPPHIKFTHYYNIKNNHVKLERLLKNFEFTTLGEIIKDNNYTTVKIK